jgi:hypothetical protein
MLFDGIVGKGSHIRVENTVVNNCGRYNLLASFGGLYDLRHCTFDMDSRSFSRSQPSMAILNINRDQLGQIISEHPINFYMGNSIVHGNFLEGEIGLDINGSASVNLEYNLLNTEQSIFKGNNNILNELPRYVGSLMNNYALDTLSPAKDQGRIFIPEITDDIRDQARDGQPDLGAFESDF